METNNLLLEIKKLKKQLLGKEKEIKRIKNKKIKDLKKIKYKNIQTQTDDFFLNLESGTEKKSFVEPEKKSFTRIKNRSIRNNKNISIIESLKKKIKSKQKTFFKDFEKLELEISYKEKFSIFINTNSIIYTPRTNKINLLKVNGKKYEINLTNNKITIDKNHVCIEDLKIDIDINTFNENNYIICTRPLLLTINK